MLNCIVQFLDKINAWVKFVFQSSDYDVNIFKSHGTKSAPPSKEKLANVPLAGILDKAGWKSESSIVKFCDKKIVEDIHRMQIWRTTRSSSGTSRMKARLVGL